MTTAARPYDFTISIHNYGSVAAGFRRRGSGGQELKIIGVEGVGTEGGAPGCVRDYGGHAHAQAIL